MNKQSRNKIELSKEQKQQAIQNIKEYFENERDESIGDLAAELVLDFITEKIGPHIYNQAILDMQKYMSEQFDDMLEETYGFMR